MNFTFNIQPCLNRVLTGDWGGGGCSQIEYYRIFSINAFT